MEGSHSSLVRVKERLVRKVVFEQGLEGWGRFKEAEIGWRGCPSMDMG